MHSDTKSDRTDRARWISLVILCTGFLMIVLDQTIVNVALPSIQSDLGFSQSSLAWVVNAYLIAFGGLLLLAGRLGDLIGRKKIFMIGLVLFTLASVLCGLAQNSTMLIVARFIQGAGGALTSAVVLGMIVTMFPDPKDQAKAISIYSFVASAGASIGLLLGGFLTQAINWHWIFFVNIPIGIVAGIAAIKLLDSDEGLGLSHGTDVVGAFLIVSALMLGVYTIVAVPEHGWVSTHTLGLGALALVLLGSFVWRQATATNPLMPLRIFKSKNMSGANAVQVLMIAGMFGVFFLGALYMQNVLNYDATQVGLAFLPMALILGGMSLGLSAKLMLKFGAKKILLPGLLFVALSLVLFIRVPLDGNYFIDMFPSMVLIGIGCGLTFTALMTIAMSDTSPEDSGMASGLVSTTGQVGGAIALAVLATLSTTKTKNMLASGNSVNDSLLGGYHLAFTIGAVLAVGAAILAAFVLRPESQESANVHHGHAHASHSSESHQLAEIEA